MHAAAAAIGTLSRSVSRDTATMRSLVERFYATLDATQVKARRLLPAEQAQPGRDFWLRAIVARGAGGTGATAVAAATELRDVLVALYGLGLAVRYGDLRSDVELEASASNMPSTLKKETRPPVIQVHAAGDQGEGGTSSGKLQRMLLSRHAIGGRIEDVDLDSSDDEGCSHSSLSSSAEVTHLLSNAESAQQRKNDDRNIGGAGASSSLLGLSKPAEPAVAKQRKSFKGERVHRARAGDGEWVDPRATAPRAAPPQRRTCVLSDDEDDEGCGPGSALAVAAIQAPTPSGAAHVPSVPAGTPSDRARASVMPASDAQSEAGSALIFRCHAMLRSYASAALTLCRAAYDMLVGSMGRLRPDQLATATRVLRSFESLAIKALRGLGFVYIRCVSLMLTAEDGTLLVAALHHSAPAVREAALLLLRDLLLELDVRSSNRSSTGEPCAALDETAAAGAMRSTRPSHDGEDSVGGGQVGRGDSDASIVSGIVQVSESYGTRVAVYFAADQLVRLAACLAIAASLSVIACAPARWLAR